VTDAAEGCCPDRLPTSLRAAVRYELRDALRPPYTGAIGGHLQRRRLGLPGRLAVGTANG
jgi:hypothetical protein